MEKFKAIINEILQKEVEIEAENEADALFKTEQAYYREDIVLGPQDFVDINCEVVWE